MSSNLSASRVRELAAGMGPVISVNQWQGYLRWGLLGESDRWTTETVDRLEEIVELGREVRSRPRRVLLLRRNYLKFPVAPKYVKCAIKALIPAISGRKQKMTRLHSACEFWERRMANPARQETGRTRFAIPIRKWISLIETIDPDDPSQRITGYYYFLTVVLPPALKGTTRDISDIPFEEQVALFAVRDIGLMTQG
jgi:hypothetical protein